MKHAVSSLVLGAALVLPCLRPGQMSQPITGAPLCVNSKHGRCQTCRPDAPQIPRPTVTVPTRRRPRGHGYQRG